MLSLPSDNLLSITRILFFLTTTVHSTPIVSSAGLNMGFFQVTILCVAAMLVMSPRPGNAHMILAEPVPFGNPNNSPLEPSGSDFPCKSVPYTIKTMNAWPVGSTQKLAFTGTAIHGGGSCQVSVTTDKEPTKASKWKVVHSFEGGCPSAVKNNLQEGGPNSNTTFPFQVPSELPNGQLTMAWTWFNKQGNREFYMNCAPVTVSGGASDASALKSLPDMAIANIEVAGSCGKTQEDFDYTFAQPGKYKTSGGLGPFKPLCANQAAPGGGSPGGGSPASAPAAVYPVASDPASVAPAFSQAPMYPSAHVPTSTLHTVIIVTASAALPSLGGAPTDSATPTTAPTVPSVASLAPVAAPIAAAPQASAVPSSAPTPAPGQGTSNGKSCSPDGAMVCSADGSQFAVCNFGTAVFQAVAPGTHCSNGAVARRAFVHRVQRNVV